MCDIFYWPFRPVFDCFISFDQSAIKKWSKRIIKTVFGLYKVGLCTWGCSVMPNSRLKIMKAQRWISDFYWLLWQISSQFTFRPFNLSTDVHTYGSTVTQCTVISFVHLQDKSGDVVRSYAQRTNDYPPELLVSRVNFCKLHLQPDNQSYQVLFVFAVQSNLIYVNKISYVTVWQPSIRYLTSGLKL